MNSDIMIVSLYERVNFCYSIFISCLYFNVILLNYIIFLLDIFIYSFLYYFVYSQNSYIALSIK